MLNTSEKKLVEENLKKKFAALVGDFSDLFDCLPVNKDKEQGMYASVAYAFQDTAIYLAFATLTDSSNIEAKCLQYEQAIRHLRQGIKVGWKLRILDAKLHAEIVSKPDSLLKELISCRLGEYKDYSQNRSTDAIELSIVKLRELYKWVHKIDEIKCTKSDSSKTSPAANFKISMLIHRWAQYELILCALSGTKYTSVLTEFIAAFLNGLSVEKLQVCIVNIIQEIVWLLTKNKYPPLLSKEYDSSPDGAHIQQVLECMDKRKEADAKNEPLEVALYKVVMYEALVSIFDAYLLQNFDVKTEGNTELPYIFESTYNGRNIYD